MSLLKELIAEMGAAGATSAHDVASGAGSLFGGGVVDTNKAKRKGRRMLRRAGVMESLGVDLGKNDFDASDVISKMDSAERKVKAADDTTAFGMEDEDGNLVKVYVRNNQAEEFEQTLAALLAGADQDDDDRNSSVEIAEVLFQLKDKYEIVDVEWPTIQGDEEEEQEVEGDDEAPEGEGEDDEMDMEASVQAEDGEGASIEGDLDAELGDDGGMDGGEDAAASALTQVIDALKADAEARQAEAKAKEAEANAKEAEYTAKASASKVTQEEQILDMEAYNDDKKNQDKEAKTLAQLAKYKHDLAKDDMGEESTTVAVKKTEENEEEGCSTCNDKEIVRGNPGEMEDAEMSQDELATLVFKHLRAQQ